jgi:hypothetical protein
VILWGKRERMNEVAAILAHSRSSSSSKNGRTRPLETSINYRPSCLCLESCSSPSPFSFPSQPAKSSTSPLYTFCALQTVIHRQATLNSSSFLTHINSIKMTLTDEELDRDWQPNGRRPQSSVFPYTCFSNPLKTPTMSFANPMLSRTNF